jgi:ankyrin repeat protein
MALRHAASTMTSALTEDLLIAAGNGDAEKVSTAIRGGAILEAVDTKGWTALLCAAYKGRATVIPILLTAGANIGAVDKNGWTALMLAAYNGHTSPNFLQRRPTLKLCVRMVGQLSCGLHTRATPLSSPYFLQWGPILTL